MLPPSRDRRRFLKEGTAISATVASGLASVPMVHSQTHKGGDGWKLSRLPWFDAAVGGNGAIRDSMSIDRNIQLVALADLDPAQLEVTRRGATKDFEGKVKIADHKMRLRM